MNKKIRIGNRFVGDSEPLFIIAECGVTCNYNMDIAKKLIEVVADSGADAIKFIFWFPDEIMSDRTVNYSYSTLSGPKSENMYEMLQKLRFTMEQWKELKHFSDQKGVILFSTVNSPSGIEYAESLKLDAYKLSSWDFNYIPLWKKIARLNKPMLIDTGPVTQLDVAKVLQVMQDAGNSQVVLIHCYHTDKHSEMNMRTIPYMKKAFDCPVGFSSSDTQDEMDLVSVSLGACVIEKRLTLDRALPGHHHILSKEPGEFKEYVQKIRNVHAALGEFQLKPSQGDLRDRKKYFRRIVANQKILAGTKLEPSMLEGKRPEEGGISPEYMEFFTGKTLKKNLNPNDPLTWDHI